MRAGRIRRLVEPVGQELLVNARRIRRRQHVRAAVGANILRIVAHQSVAFANFIRLGEERTGGRVRYEIISMGNSDPLMPYPVSPEGVSSSQWNRIAAANNRIRHRIRSPEAPGHRCCRRTVVLDNINPDRNTNTL